MSLDSAIKNNRKAFKEVKKIYHYTTLDTLYKILESKALIFNRNDKLNDMLEHSRSIDAGFDYYVSCFSHNEIESIPLWFIYAKKMGIRITFNSKDIFTNRMYYYHKGKKEYFSYEVQGYEGDTPLYSNVHKIDGNTIIVGNLIGTTVIYDDKALELKHTQKYGGGSYHISMTNVYQLAAVKGTAWAYEYEARYFITTNGHYNFIESIFIELEDSVFNEFQVIFSPFYTDAECCDLKKNLRAKYPNVKFDFKESCLYGTIQ